MVKLKEFTLQELAEATGGFHPLGVIGEGGFGQVYRAMINLTPVAIKVQDTGSLQGQGEFSTEMEVLSGLAHPHIVRLLGYCAQGGARCLVYELMCAGNLEDRLGCKNGTVPLAWRDRVKVAAHIASALAHLHGRSGGAIIHRDIKPANVFLDSELNAKLGDVGLAATGQALQERPRGGGQAIGTWSYLAPEYRSEGRCSAKTDVYAFGLCLLQLATAAESPKGLLERCRAAMAEGLAPSLLDSSAGHWDTGVAERLLKMGLWCCQEAPEERPSMSLVHSDLARLWGVLQQR